MATIVCPSCSAQYRISDEKISPKSRLRCKKCGTVFRLHDTLQEAEGKTASATGQATSNKEKPGQPTGPSSEVPTLEFDLSALQLNTPPTSQEPETLSAQEDLSLDMNLGDLKLDFGQSSEPASEGETLSFNHAVSSDTGSVSEQEEDIHDHITEIQAEQPDSDFLGFSFQADNQQDESGEGADDSFDFSFSANIPEDSEEEDFEEEDQEEGEVEGIHEEAEETSEDQEIGLPLDDLNLGISSAETISAYPAHDQDRLPPSEEDELGPLSGLESSVPEEETFVETDLANCCIDSLAMGLVRCDICGRDLKDYQQYAKELQQQRRQQLKEELVKAEVQIGFSEELSESGGMKTTEDFTDVERALDALADGSFQESIKKKEAQKTRAKTLRMLVAVVILAVAVGGGILWYLLPSSHEKLVTRYEELMAQQEAEPTTLVRLFLDAIIARDEQIFRDLSVMKAMPEITKGRILGASDEFEKTSLGSPGQEIAQLKEEIATLEKQINDKTILLNEYSSKTFSPAALEQTIHSLENKIEELHAEFEVRDAELVRKLINLRQELQETEEEIEKHKALSRKYLDATDTVGKALYTNSLTQLRALDAQKADLETEIQQENAEYQQKHQALQEEFAPRFSDLENRLAEAQAILKEANLLQDRERSPVVILSKELEQMTTEIIEKKRQLEQAENQLQEALSFFKLPEQRNRIVQEQQAAEISSIEKNVAVMLRAGTSSEQQVSVVLKRYEAILPDATLQSNWLVEKIAK